MHEDSNIHSGVKVPGRLVPFPASISPEARAALKRLVGPDGAPLNNLDLPAADDFAGWDAASKKVNAFMAQIRPNFDDAHSAPVETLDMGGAVVYVANPPDTVPDDRVYLEIHGGAFAHGDGEVCRIGARTQAHLHGVRCYAVDYRRPPRHPYPAPLDDCVAAYRGLLQRYPPESIVIGGASAGGNLAAATVLRARDEGLPLPAALVLPSPALDLTESGDSRQTNRFIDVMLPNPDEAIGLLYAGGHDLTHPNLSPLFGDFSKGFPPTLIQAGTRDVLLSDVARMSQALRRAGVPVVLIIAEGMPHGGFMGAPEDLEIAAEIRQFAASHWGRRAATERKR